MTRLCILETLEKIRETIKRVERIVFSTLIGSIIFRALPQCAYVYNTYTMYTYTKVYICICNQKMS